MSRDVATELEHEPASPGVSMDEGAAIEVPFEDAAPRFSFWKWLRYHHPGQPPRFLWYYVVGVAIFSVAILFQLFAHIPHVPDTADEPHALSSSIAQQEAVGAERFRVIRQLFIMTMGMTLCCGALGGCLFDMRGLIKHSAAGDFNPLYNASYLLRPFAGATSGFIVFLVLVGGLFSLEIQPPTNRNVEQDWIILRRQLPFMAFAMLAGYASHVFMMKLKDVSEVVFSSSERMKPNDKD